jgi:Zn-dependent oligopeptidase
MKAKGVMAKWTVDKLTVKEIEETTEALIKKYGEAYDSIGQIKPEDVTFENTIQALMNLDREFTMEEAVVTFAQHVVTDKTLRDASVEADKKLSVFAVDLNMKKDLFDNVCAFKDRVGLEKLTAEEKRWVEKEIVKGKRNGLHLSTEKQEAVKSKRKLPNLALNSVPT